MAALPALRRFLHNAGRIPRRFRDSLGRRLDPSYRLEREAKLLTSWFAPGYLARLESVPGMCGHRECRLVALLATRAPTGGAIVEIGAWKGRMTAWLVEAAERRANRPPVISIDPHHRDSWDGFCRTVADFRLAERGLQVVRERSYEVAHNWSKPISLLWIDGSHEYDDVTRDIAGYTPHVVADGLIAFDDSAGGEFPGVERAIAEWHAAEGDFAHVATLRNVTIFRRRA